MSKLRTLSTINKQGFGINRKGRGNAIFVFKH